MPSLPYVGSHGELVVLILELLGLLVGVANGHVAAAEDLAIVQDPVEHLEESLEKSLVNL